MPRFESHRTETPNGSGVHRPWQKIYKIEVVVEAV